MAVIVVSNNKTHVSVERYCLSVTFGFSRHIFNTVPNITKIRRVGDALIRMHGRMTKPIGVFRDCVNPPKNVCSQRQYFYARLENCEEQTLASTCLSVRSCVCLRLTTRLPLDGFS